MSSFYDILTSLAIWLFVLFLYIIMGAIFGKWLSTIRRHQRDDLRWLGLGIFLFTFVLFPLTFYFCVIVF
tara:strand:- start:45058 stop:45267 length:210 start_codon:yes stop_codon:yes gene_type:complete